MVSKNLSSDNYAEIEELSEVENMQEIGVRGE